MRQLGGTFSAVKGSIRRSGRPAKCLKKLSPHQSRPLPSASVVSGSAPGDNLSGPVGRRVRGGVKSLGNSFLARADLFPLDRPGSAGRGQPRPWGRRGAAWERASSAGPEGVGTGCLWRAGAARRGGSGLPMLSHRATSLAKPFVGVTVGPGNRARRFKVREELLFGVRLRPPSPIAGGEGGGGCSRRGCKRRGGRGRRVIWVKKSRKRAPNPQSRRREFPWDFCSISCYCYHIRGVWIFSEDV